MTNVILFICVAFVVIVLGVFIFMVGPDFMDDMIDTHVKWQRVLRRLHEGRDNHD